MPPTMSAYVFREEEDTILFDPLVTGEGHCSRRSMRSCADACFFEAWESKTDFDNFLRVRLMPIVEEVSGANATPPQVTVYDLHSYTTV